MKHLKNILLIVAFALAFVPASAQARLGLDDEPSINWKVDVARLSDSPVFELTLTGRIQRGWHTYGLGNGAENTVFELDSCPGLVPEGEASWSIEGQTFVIKQKVRVEKSGALSGAINWQSCTDDTCRMREEWSFSVSLTPEGEEAISDGGATMIAAGKADGASSKGLWALILEAILWGFAMLLTPCVFPMVPMTISFFMKGDGSKAAGRFKAGMYGLFIVLLYTVPICIIIGLTWLIGGAGVTADIFNWLSTHWLPNIIFFLVFMAFAASFFGAFEITLPAKWVNASDKKSDRGGLLGVFFLALTLVLVSFSCTGPIVGTVLIKSTQGEFWVPMLTMLAFSIAFALPFTLLAFFPALLKKLPKSGGWLNSVKVTLGFIEIALGLKFLSVADQTYHWGLLDRPVYLAIWIVCFTLLGFYLLGKLRFKYDTELKYISIGRLALAIVDFAFVVWMIPGMWGAPLKALSGYLPPMETQDFVLQKYATDGGASTNGTLELGGASYFDGVIEMPHGLKAYTSIEKGCAAAAATDRRVFVDITGHGCVNCREMEARVWSDPAVLARLREDFVMVALYTDDKTRLPESDWITGEDGKLLKDVGRVNSYIVRNRFGVNAQPNYIILDASGQQISPVRGYDLSIPGFLEFLK